MSDRDYEELQSILIEMTSLSLPGNVVTKVPFLHDLLNSKDPLALVGILAGLQTRREYQANILRLDYAVRLALALGNGNSAPRRTTIQQLLNGVLISAGVTNLEDPIEGFFVEPLLTSAGEYLLFAGLQEKPAFHTECLLRAFAELPDGEPKAIALNSVYALLALSDALAKRSHRTRWEIGENNPKMPISIPTTTDLNHLASEAFFSRDELAELSIDGQLLDIFTLGHHSFGALLTEFPGESRLDFCPLIKIDDGILVASPSGISTAVRYILIDIALKGHFGNRLRNGILRAQADMVTQSGFIRLNRPDLNRRYGQQFVHEVSSGRFMQVVQVVDDFDTWPEAAFGSRTILNETLSKEIHDSITQAKQAAKKLRRFQAGMTLIIMGGWGRSRSIAIPSDPLDRDWPVVFIEPGDAIILGGCTNGSKLDIWRLYQQLELVSRQGITFSYANGLLNLFEWWRQTEYYLVPKHARDASPPLNISFDTNLIRLPREEGTKAINRRSLPFPMGAHRIVHRLEPKPLVGEPREIYVSLNDISKGSPLGAIHTDQSTIWLELVCPRDDPNAQDKIETWQAALNWIHFLAPHFIEHFSINLPPSILIKMKIDWPSSTRMPQNAGAEDLVSVEMTDSPLIKLNPEWQLSLRRVDNHAEATLATALLLCMSRLGGDKPTFANLYDFVISIAGTDYRWRHSLTARRASEELWAAGLTQQFRPIPQSVGALMRCGGVWNTHNRKNGTKFHDKNSCLALLHEQASFQLDHLLTKVRQYDTRSLVIASFDAFQAALAADRHWEMTARALRRIYGVEDDHSASWSHATEVNAVIRASSILIEVAACEHSDLNSNLIGDMDLAELQAKSILLFQTLDLIPAIALDRIPPDIEIAPTGEILFDQEFERATLRRMADLRHGREREKQSREYRSLGVDTKNEEIPPELDADLVAAIRAEYGADSNTYLKLGFSLSTLAIQRGRSTLVLEKADLIDALARTINVAENEVERLIDRLTLPSRAGWFDFPAGASAADFDLSRFDRRYSLIGRPIVPMGSGENPILVVGAGIVERSIVHNLSGAMHGTLQNNFWRSRQMQQFASRSGANVGLEFNNLVANSLRSLGMASWASAKPSWCLNRKATDELKQLGDIDVLGISPDGTRVWVIEAKDLKLCRTLGETARRLSEYRGLMDEKGRPDKMRRHLNRVEFVRAHAFELVKPLKLDRTPQVSGIVVVRAPQPMETIVLADEFDAKVVMLDDMMSVPWNNGWQA